MYIVQTCTNCSFLFQFSEAFLNTYRLHKTEQSFFISLPFCVKLDLWGEFVTAELHSDLQTVSVQVVEVWHTCNRHMYIMSPS